ncbi:hypothetical protein DXG01_002049, partial [Tephrocybe rancida]
MRLLSLYFILILAVPSLCSTVATALADLAVVQNNLNSLNSAVTAFPPYSENINFSTAGQLLAAISAATALVAADAEASLPLSQCVALNPSPVNDTDGRVLVDRIKALEPSIVDTRAKLLQRKGVVAVVVEETKRKTLETSPEGFYKGKRTVMEKEGSVVVAVLPAIPLVGNPKAMARASIFSLQATLNSTEDPALKAAPASLVAEAVAVKGRFDNNMNGLVAT